MRAQITLRRVAALKEMAGLGCCKAKAARLLKVDRSLIGRICRIHSVQMPDGIRVPNVQRRTEVMTTMLNAGRPQKHVAEFLGISRSRLSQLIGEYGVSFARATYKRTRDLTLRRSFALREMATLDVTQVQAAILMEIAPERVSQLCKEFDIHMTPAKKGRPGWLTQRILRDFGKPGMTPSIMTERYGCHPKSVDVTICRLRKEGKLPPVQQRC